MDDATQLLIEKLETKICQLTRVVYIINNKYLNTQATIESIYIVMKKN
jgi:hypothetical protein